MSEKLTHVDEAGAARMVNVSAKPRTARRAIARGRLSVSPAACTAVLAGTAPKGDVLAAARIAGIMAAKRTADLIPLCHSVPLSAMQVHLHVDPAGPHIEIVAEAETIDRTGVEMEALTAVSVAALTLYDMLKAVDRALVIESIELVEKLGGMRSRGVPRPLVTVVPKDDATPPLVSPPAPEIAPRLDLPVRLATTPAPTDSVESVEMQYCPPRQVDPEAMALATNVRELGPDDFERLRDYLRADRVQNAYLLGDLDLPYVEQSRWFGASDLGKSTLRGVLLLYDGLSMPAVLTAGDPLAVEALFAGANRSLPRRFYGHVLAQHRPALDVFYRSSDLHLMIRMALERDAWVRGATTEGVERLTHRDTAAIMGLYAHYPDNFFEPAQLDTGLYFGVRKGGELVSVGGVHVISETHDVAVVGNLVTHTEHRGRGLGSKVVAGVIEALFARVSLVALNVRVDNVPAVACYRKFGFSENHQFLEGWVRKR